ncbi:MAG TPA: DUF885 domain-containing protein [Candidatus Dormibacteraeota bacterium]|nr:DUF885 domain-containing protein [Candidatus Dormibacteraeota bacterium]
MADWAAVEREVIEGFFRFSPSYGREAGDHRFDGVVGDPSKAAIGARVEEIDRQVHQLTNLAALNRDQDIDRRALLAQLRATRFELTELQTPFREPMFYAGYGTELDVSAYLKREYAPLPERLAAMRRQLAGYHGYLETARANLEPALPRPNLEIAIEAVNGQVEYLEGEVRQAAAGDAATVQAIDRAATETRAFVDFLKGRQAQAHDDFALGEQRFLRLLTMRELVELDVNALERMVRADIERNRAAAMESAEQLAPGLGISEALHRVQERHPSAASIVDDVAGMLEGLRRFILERDLVAIPSEVRCQVRPTPSYFAYITAALDPAGPLETVATESYYYVTLPRPDWGATKTEEWLRALNYAVLENTSVHEAYPGHYLQSLHERRISSLTRKLFWSYANVEGFAHYCELMMVEAGYSTDPGVRLAQALDALLRDARSLVALGLHTRSMPMADAIETFRSVAFLSELPATREAMRGAWDPLYLNYTLGKLLIMDLRRELQQKRAGEFSLRRFHDAFLGCGYLPIPLIRELLS